MQCKIENVILKTQQHSIFSKPILLLFSSKGTLVKLITVRQMFCFLELAVSESLSVTDLYVKDMLKRWCNPEDLKELLRTYVVQKGQKESYR